MLSYKILYERYERLREENKKLLNENYKLNNRIKHNDITIKNRIKSQNN